jgi:nickel transport system ATP-binding protein
MNDDILLDIRGLSIVIREGPKAGTEIVRGIDLRVDRGQVTGIIGESGCGKTMTTLAILGLLPRAIGVKKGQILFQGEDVLSMTPEQVRRLRGRRIAVILQNPMSCFDPVFTVGYHLEETLRAHGLPVTGTRSRLLETLARMGFDRPETILKAFPFQLSGGMLQRVMIAMALLLDADLIIADEPTTDLDLVSQASVLDLLDEIRKEKEIGMLLVTHDLSVIARLADRVSVMKEGLIVESGTTLDLFERPNSDYAGSLLASHLKLYGLTRAS